MNAATPLSSTAPAQPRFIKIGEDGSLLAPEATEWVAVLDTKTNLMWDAKARAVEGFQEAQAVPGTLSVAGFTDWRMPTVEELFCLADRTRVRPAIDTAFFPDAPNDWFWSSDVYASSPSGFAWFVYFGNGYSYWNFQGVEGFVRAVRPGQNVKPWGYFAPPGTGPKGETCQTCRHCVACGHSSHRYLKCLRAQGKWTHGRKTDILARSPACSGWEAMEAAR